MDKTARKKFIESDMKLTEKNDAKINYEKIIRKKEHYNILESDEYSHIIRNF